MILHANVSGMFLAKASNINETELAAAAKDGLPNIPGLDFFK